MQTLEQFDIFTAENFKQWLTKELKGKWNKDPEVSYRSCDLRSLEIPFRESHIDVLQMLFKKLSCEAKTSFRKAVEDLLSLPPRDFPYDATEDLKVISFLINQ